MLTMFSKLYGRLVANRNADYESGIKKSVKVTVPVVSVGNISTGGTGKTPMVQFIVRELQKAGYSPAVILRGYRRKSRGLCVVHNGERILCNVRESGDEAMLHSITLGVPVVVCKHKVDAAVYVAGQTDADVIVADDAFQHRELHRDVDVVLVNNQTYSDSLLPVGRLREPISSLQRADVVINTETMVEYSYTFHLLTNDGWTQNTETNPTAAIVVCAIANPHRFVSALKAESVIIDHKFILPDHSSYSSRVLAKIIQRATALSLPLVVTTKDAVKLSNFYNLFKDKGIRVYVLQMELRNSQVLRNLMQVITSKIILFDREYDEDSSVQSLGQ
jgi:tetraacyldisaccharide 4'-kinase